jgi:transcriptional regulator with XRE-family HTH domain
MGNKRPWDEDRQRLYGALRQLRESAGIRQTEVAERLGTPQSYVSKYENGERRLDLIELERICNALEITLEDLLAAYRGDRGTGKTSRRG